MIKLIKSTFFHEESTKKALCTFITKAHQLSFGPQCELFEREFARWQGRKYCIMLNSGSSADLAMVQTLINLGKLQRGDAIGFSAITWSTNVMSLIQMGLKPIPIDVELDTLNVSSATLQHVILTRKIKALFLTNLLGFCSDIDVIRAMCKKNNIIMIEDNCESLGTVYKEKKLGNFGLMSSFSFYVGHHMSTIEGGAVCTDDEKLSTMLRLVRAHGWDRNLSFAKQEQMRKKYRVNSTFYSRYTFYDLGYNFRPTEIAGYIGQLQIPFLAEILQKRKDNFLTFAKEIYTHTEKYYPLRFSHIDFVSNFALPVICKTKSIRDELVKRCDGILEIRPIVGGDMTAQPFFKQYVSDTYEDCNNAKLIHEQGLYFGNNPEMTQKEMNTIIRLFTS